MKRSLLLCLIGGLSVGASPALAQHSQTRQGFWFNIGLGYGSLGCQGCSGRTGGLSGGRSLRRNPTPQLPLGVGAARRHKTGKGGAPPPGPPAARPRLHPPPPPRLLLP